MSKSGLILPEETDLSGKPKQFKATVVYQDENYTIMRNVEKVTEEDILNVPLHLVLIGCGMLSAAAYVPRVGKEGFLNTVKKLKKQFNDNIKVQRAKAENFHVGQPVKRSNHE